MFDVTPCKREQKISICYLFFYVYADMSVHVVVYVAWK